MSKLYLVGTGPGDPELLTLKAVRVLAMVDSIAFPKKAGQTSMSYQIAQQHVNPKAELLPIDIPMAVDRKPAQAAYDSAATAIVAQLSKGKNVVYLCEGDPLFYGSAMYLIERMPPEIEVVVVPGITSLTATAAAITRPLAARNDILKVLPAPLDDTTLQTELANTPAVAIIKLGRHFDRVRAVLEASGHAENAILVEHASGAEQTITPLSEVDTNHRPYFATILCYKGAEAWAS